jgi:hypothetical protein
MNEKESYGQEMSSMLRHNIFVLHRGTYVFSKTWYETWYGALADSMPYCFSQLVRGHHSDAQNTEHKRICLQNRIVLVDTQ